jgi:hypothetical protein
MARKNTHTRLKMNTNEPIIDEPKMTTNEPTTNEPTAAEEMVNLKNLKNEAAILRRKMMSLRSQIDNFKTPFSDDTYDAYVQAIKRAVEKNDINLLPTALKMFRNYCLKAANFRGSVSDKIKELEIVTNAYLNVKTSAVRYEVTGSILSQDAE